MPQQFVGQFDGEGADRQIDWLLASEFRTLPSGSGGGGGQCSSSFL